MCTKQVSLNYFGGTDKTHGVNDCDSVHFHRFSLQIRPTSHPVGMGRDQMSNKAGNVTLTKQYYFSKREFVIVSLSLCQYKDLPLSTVTGNTDLNGLRTDQVLINHLCPVLDG